MSSVPRVLVRISLLVVLVVAVAVIVSALSILGPREVETWAAIAAALAVITSISSSWTAQRVFELQEDEQRPAPYPSIDVTSRYELLQLRVTNFGGGAAHDVRLLWDAPLVNSKGEKVTFAGELGGPEIPVLLPGESIATPIDGHVQFFERYPGAEARYSGSIAFVDAAGRSYQRSFRLSAEQYAKTSSHEEEALRTHVDLQKIPHEIQELTSEVARLRHLLEAHQKGSSA